MKRIARAAWPALPWPTPLWLVALCLGALACGPSAQADDDDDASLRRVSFRVERDREVANDWLRVTLSTTDEDADPAALAGRVNETMAWALGKARGETRVRTRSGGYNTHPVFDKNRIRRWRASQELVIESADFEAATALLGKLQTRLELRSMDFSVSPELRREVQDELIGEALGAFQERATLVRKKLGASGFEIVRLAIDTPGGSAPPRPFMARSSMATAEMAPPAVAGGTSRIQVQVAATIELE